jgi:hypothetical protein
MVHTYEVLVDIKEYSGYNASTCHNATSRYEVDAESRHSADVMARAQARSEHPHATELDSRVTRLLR